MPSKGLLLQGGGGGVSSDELTATSAHVLENYSYVGKDTDDEAGVGTIPIKHSHTHDNSVSGQLGIVGIQLFARFPSAYYEVQNGVNPYVYIPFADLAEVLGIEAAKMLATETIAGVQGTIPTKAAATYYATTSDQTISAKQYLGGAQTIKALTQTNLVAANIIKGKTITINNGNANVWSVAGSLDVQSILSFSAAPYSTSQITFTWKNPAKGAFSGVIIVGKTGSYPTSVTDGTRYYKGSGNNTAANGTSSATVGGFTQGTTYYFRAFAYAVKNNAEWVCSSSKTATATTKPQGQQIFTESGTFTVPANVTSIDIFCVGGGGSGGHSNSTSSQGNKTNAGGGGAGYTATKKGHAVSAGQTFAVTIGAGGPHTSGSSSVGGTTSFGSVLSATGGNGGQGGKVSGSVKGGDGGSGGGGAGGSGSYATYAKGGSDGSDGVTGKSGTPGKGQGTTTRAFGESGGTLYAGGGGGHNTSSSGGGGAGGDGGGGAARTNGTANTGGGGGASGYSGSSVKSGAGGSGICIVRWGY